MASALPLAFATSRDDIAHSLQIERPSMSFAEVVELHDERDVVRRKTPSKVELHLEESPSLLYEEGELRVPKLKETSSKKGKLLSSLIWADKKKRKSATRRESGKKDGYWELKLKTSEEMWTKKR